MVAGKVELYGNLIALGAALGTFAILFVSYLVFMQKIQIRTEFIIIFMIINICIFVFLITFITYVESNLIVACK
jgi:hypothetical protein